MKLFFNTVCLFGLLVVTLSAQPDPGASGPFPHGWYTVTVTRDARSMSCRVYYPALLDGENAAIDTANGPYPVIAFGHGFLTLTSYYISVFERLSSHGFIVIAPQFTDTQHGELGKDLVTCLNYVKSLSRMPGDRFFGLVDTLKTGVSGHSMGGGASLLATLYDTTIVVSAPFVAAETTPSIIGSINTTKSWIYLISAQNDGITPPVSTQIPMYNNAPGNKALLTIKGANHTKFMDNSLLDWSDPRGYLSRPRQIYTSQKYLTAAMRYFLKGEDFYRRFVFGDSVAADTSVILETTVGIRGKPRALLGEFSVSQNYPNPFNPVTRIEYSLPVASRVTIEIFRITGEETARIDQGEVPEGVNFFGIDAGKLGLESGVYIYRVIATGEDGRSHSAARKFVLIK